MTPTAIRVSSSQYCWWNEPYPDCGPSSGVSCYFINQSNQQNEKKSFSTFNKIVWKFKPFISLCLSIKYEKCEGVFFLYQCSHTHTMNLTRKKEGNLKISLTLMGELHRKSTNSLMSFGGSWWICVWYFVYNSNSVFLLRLNESLSTSISLSWCTRGLFHWYVYQPRPKKPKNANQREFRDEDERRSRDKEWTEKKNKTKTKTY